jgi:NCAIR mutase (PurE)-related protein
MREILERLLSGEISTKEAEKLLQISTMKQIEDVALDIRREIRTGIPEVVWSEDKTSAKVVEIASALLGREGRAIISRISQEQTEALREALSDEYDLGVNEKARLVVVRRRGFQTPWLGRKIGVMTAGTSDVIVAEEARIIAEEMGCQVLTAYDVGIAGFHRHIEPLERMVEEEVDAIVVVAGMEGALPSVVASLVDVPVIGVPSSVGYGFGAGGIGALTAMLQSCSPGLCVVNIDNGFGAGAYAALIAKRVAKAIKESREGK